MMRKIRQLSFPSNSTGMLRFTSEPFIQYSVLATVFERRKGKWQRHAAGFVGYSD
jgi:hypothetical protein